MINNSIDYTTEVGVLFVVIVSELKRHQMKFKQLLEDFKKKKLQL